MLIDGVFFAAIGVSVSIFAGQSYVAGSGPFGGALQGQPYVVGFVEAGLLIAVIGAGLFAAGALAPLRIWHGWAILAHITLATIDLSYLDTMVSMGLPATNLVALASIHALFVAAHTTVLAGARKRMAMPG